MLSTGLLAVTALLLLGTANAEADDDDVYTLYRSSLIQGISRIRVATFNSKEGDDFNHKKCELAANMFKAQPGVKTRFWCEHGYYRK